MTQSVPATTTAQAPIAAPEGKQGATPPLQKPAKVEKSTAKMPKDDWLKAAADEISETNESHDEDDSGEPSAPSKGKTAKAAPERGEDGKFLPADGKVKEDAKPEKKPEAPAKKKDDAEEVLPATKEPKEDEPTAEKIKAGKEALDAEIKSFNDQVREDRIKSQSAWTQIHREAAKIRQREEVLKSTKSELERLQKLEARLKTDGERYRVVEEVGGSLGDWQKRAMSGEGPSPQLEDFRKFVEERDKKWEAKLEEVKQAELRRQDEDVARESFARVRSAESKFDNTLLEEAGKYEHTKAMGPSVVDKAHDFAEYVARALQYFDGTRKGLDIPRSEQPWVREYLDKTPKAVALDPGQIMSYFSNRVAREASIWSSPKPPEPQRAATVVEEPAVAERRTSRGTPTLDNSVSGTRATPATPQNMSRAEFDKWALDHIHELDDDEIEDPKHRR